MSIQEISKGLTLTSKPTAPDRLFGNLPEGKRTKVASSDEAALRSQLQKLWDMPIPAGPEGNGVYHQRQKDIRKVERQLRKLGINAFSGGGDNDD